MWPRGGAWVWPRRAAAARRVGGGGSRRRPPSPSSPPCHKMAAGEGRGVVVVRVSRLQWKRRRAPRGERIPPPPHTPARARLTGRRGLLKRIEFLGKKTFLTWHKAAQAAGKSQPIQGWAPGALPSCRGLAASGCCSTWRFCSSPLKAGLLMDPDQAL